LKKIAITGGIGSGKSIVSRILETMHFPVYYSDRRSREIVDTDPDIREQLIDLFGDEVYHSDKLNRHFMATKIFSNEELRLKVNSIVHPKVRDDFKLWLADQKNDLVFNEAAIFMENDSYKKFDATILVIAPEEIKIERVTKRDNLSREEVLSRMSKQWSDEKKMKLTKYHLINDDHSPLLSQVESMIEKLRKDLKV